MRTLYWIILDGSSVLSMNIASLNAVSREGVAGVTPETGSMCNDSPALTCPRTAKQQRMVVFIGLIFVAERLSDGRRVIGLS